MRAHRDVYRVLLDGNWELVDLYEFPRTFEQCYAFIYCLDTELKHRDRERIEEAFAAYPWRGGYSYVNIYTVMQNQVPDPERPKIKSISYASAGWLDLFLNVDVAIQVAEAVGVLAASMVTAAEAYAKAMKTLSNIKAEREKARLRELQLTRAQHQTLMKMSEDLAKFLGFKNVKELHQKTGSPEISVKLLAAHYRRIAVLIEFVEEEMIVLPKRPG